MKKMIFMKFVTISLESILFRYLTSIMKQIFSLGRMKLRKFGLFPGGQFGDMDLAPNKFLFYQCPACICNHCHQTRMPGRDISLSLYKNKILHFLKYYRRFILLNCVDSVISYRPPSRLSMMMKEVSLSIFIQNKQEKCPYMPTYIFWKTYDSYFRKLKFYST